MSGGALNLVGERYGRLVVIEQQGRDRFGDSLWLCQCDCGKQKLIRGGSLRSKSTPTISCGCSRFGRKCSESTRAKRATAAKKRWSNPEFKQRMAKINEKFKKQRPPAVLCGCGCGEMASHGRVYLVGHNSRMNHPMEGRKHSDETRKKLSVSHLGQPSGRKGKKASPESILKMSISHKGKKLTEAHKKKISIKSREVWAKKSKDERTDWHRKIGDGNRGKTVSLESRKKMSKAKTGGKASEKTKALLSKVIKRRYLDSEYVEKIRKAWNRKPNKLEKRMLKILDTLFPAEWKYTGDYSFVINGKNPDFVNCNGKKKIIEVYGFHWHQGDDPQDRINEFKPFGYGTLVIWDYEFKNMECLIERLNNFMVE